MAKYVQRHAEQRVLEALTDTRVVVIEGARQVGKSTLAQRIVREVGGTMLTLDDPDVRASAEADPVGFLDHGDELLVIDEVQRTPQLILALKLLVDRDPRPGRFLVTGSANLLRMPAAEDSLAGRAESIELHGFSQGELRACPERLIDRLFARDRLAGHTSALHRQDYLEIAAAGSYPDALARRPGSRRDDWLDGYVSRIVERDAPEISASSRLGALPIILRLLAARNAEELNQARLAAEVGVPVRSLEPLLGLLETLYLVQRIPAWSTNLSARVVKRPKLSLLDAGLAARLVHASAAGAGRPELGSLAGHLLEAFVAGELRRQLGWSETRARLAHYRDHDGAEVDLILESADGRVVGIEVKASSAPNAKDARWLVRLRDRLGERFAAGLVLHTGQRALPFGERITAAPIDILWAP